LGISFDGHFNAVDADLAHTFSTGTKVSEDTQMTAPLTLVQDLFQTESVSSLAVYLYDYRQADAKSKELERLFREAGLTYDIHVWHEPELSHFYHGVMNFMQAMNIFCSLLIGSVVFLSVVNLTTMNVLQRSREMGTLKALGFGSSAISKIFIIEATVLAFLGCLAGGGLSLFISSIVNRLDIMYTPPGFSAAVVFLLLPNPLTIASVLALVFVLVLVAAAVTVGVLARRSCLQLLTHNG
jgi:putative ABC transport system permease protein